jgi:hypothetical protein
VEWNTYVDGYCERVEPGLFAEPLNAVSNLAFLVAAVLLWFTVRGAARTTTGSAGAVYPFPVLIALIFLGSSAFHTAATRWGGALDTGFIAVFLLFYVAFFVHWFAGVRWRLAWLAIPAFLIFTAVVGFTLGRVVGSGPGMYLSALLGLFAFAAWLRWSGREGLRRYWPWFAGAGTIFTVSLTFRSLDDALCGSLPIGTHFLWHALNAVTLYVVSRAGIERWREVTAGTPADDDACPAAPR